MPRNLAHFVLGQIFTKEFLMGLLLLVIVIVLLVGVTPRWSHSRNWGYGPTGGLGLVVLIVVVLMLMGRMHTGF
jgi:hypothetical protein